MIYIHMNPIRRPSAELLDAAEAEWGGDLTKIAIVDHANPDGSWSTEGKDKVLNPQTGKWEQVIEGVRLPVITASGSVVVKVH